MHTHVHNVLDKGNGIRDERLAGCSAVLCAAGMGFGHVLVYTSLAISFHPFDYGSFVTTRTLGLSSS